MEISLLEMISTGGDTANILIAFFLWHQHTRISKLEMVYAELAKQKEKG